VASMSADIIVDNTPLTETVFYLKEIQDGLFLGFRKKERKIHKRKKLN
jgi:hypothetical protein